MLSRLTPVGAAEPVELDLPVNAPEAVSKPSRDAIAAGLMLALKTLSQKTVVALASLVDLIMIGSAFVLWLLIISQPSTSQLIAVGLYAVFVLITIYVRNGRARRE